MERKKATMCGILSILLATGMVPLVPSASAGSCSAENSGWGWEEATCTFSCPEGVYIKVSASVDDNGHINGDANCGGRLATCSGSGFCSDTSNLKTVSQESNGSCKGDGYGGTSSVVWTHTKVTCSSLASSDTGSESDDDGVLDMVGDIVATGMLTSTQEAALTPEDGTAAHILGAGGAFVGYVCSSGDGCVEVTPDCTIDLTSWACRI